MKSKIKKQTQSKTKLVKGTSYKSEAMTQENYVCYDA